MSTRGKVLNDLIKELCDARPTVPAELAYALEENILLSKAMRSRLGFLWWTLFHERAVDGRRICELSDFGTHPSVDRWRELLQLDLQWLDREKPRAQRILRQEILTQVTRSHISRRRIVLADLGCGSAELDRQVLLACNTATHPILLLAIDCADSSISVAENNLRSIGSLDIRRLHSLSQQTLTELAQLDSRCHRAVLLNSHLSLLSSLEDGAIDVAYHSQLRHHLTADDNAALERTLSRIAHVWIEEDGIRGMLPLFMAFALAPMWSRPYLMNGFLLSNLRYPRWDEIEARARYGGLTLRADMLRYVIVHPNEAARSGRDVAETPG